MARLLPFTLSFLFACGTSHGSPDGSADARTDGTTSPDGSSEDGSLGDAGADATPPSTCRGESLGGAGEPCFCQGPFALGPDGIAYRSGANLDVIDVRGDAPVLLGSVPQMHIGSEGAVALADDILFVGSWGVDLFDVRTPADPRPIGGIDLEGTVTDLFVQRATLFIGYEAFDGETASLDAWDVSDPTLPRRFASLPLEGRPGSVLPFGTDAIVVLEARRFGEAGPDLATLVDVSSPSSPVVVRSLPLEGRAVLRRRGAIDGSLLHVVGNEPMLQTLDLDAGRTVATLDPVDSGPVGLGISLSDGLAFVGARGVAVVDLSPASAPRIIGTLETTGDPFYSLRDGDRLLVSNGSQLQTLRLDCF